MSTQHRIIARSEWGATKPNGSGPAPVPANGVRLHHSVTIAPDLLPPFTDDYAAVRTLEQIGHARFGAGISYTFPITPTGLIFEGHSVDRKGTHTAQRNSVERAIAFVGNYETDHPTDAQLDAAGWLLAHGYLSGWWKAAPLLGGHRDVKATACPGSHAYAAIPQINEQAKRHVDLLTNPTPEPPKGWLDMLSDEEQKDLKRKVDALHDAWIGGGKAPERGGFRKVLGLLDKRTSDLVTGKRPAKG